MLIRLKVTVWICFRRFTDITGKLEAIPGGQYHLVPWKLFYRKVFMTKLLLYLKLTVWIRFWWSLSGASWEQILVDSTIWTPRKMF